MKIKPYLYIIFLLFIFISCNNNNVKESIIIEENTPQELIKDSSLAQEIYTFVDSLRANRINEDFVLMVKFDSMIFTRTGSTVFGILMDIYPCFSDTANIWGGFLPNLDIPIVIRDDKEIGRTYYNPIFIHDKIKQKYYCDESVSEAKYISFLKSFSNSSIIGYSFIVFDGNNELRLDGTRHFEVTE